MLFLFLFHLHKNRCLIESFLYSFVVAYLFLTIPSLFYNLINFNGYCIREINSVYPCSVLRIIYESLNPFLSEFGISFFPIYVCCFLIISIILSSNHKKNLNKVGDKIKNSQKMTLYIESV